MIRTVLRYTFIGYMTIWLILAAKDWFASSYLSFFDCLRFHTFWVDKYLNINMQDFLFRELGSEGYKQFLYLAPYIPLAFIIGFIFSQLRNESEKENE